jgi:hypothetical protein
VSCVAAESDAFEMPTLRSAKSKRLLMGAVAVALLAALGGLAGWRLGWFGGNQKPKEMLRQRLEAPASPGSGASTPRPVTPPPALSPAPGVSPTPGVSPAPRPSAPQSSVPAPQSSAPMMSLGPAVTPPAPVERAASADRPASAERPAATERSAAAAPAAPKPAACPARQRSRGRRALRDRVRPVHDRARGRARRAAAERGRLPDGALRQQTGAGLYAVLIEKIPAARDAQALVASLRQQGFAEAFVVGEREPLSVQVGLPLPLRGAVQTAEKLRASGHQVRVAAQPGEAVVFALRHGNFATSGEAEAKGQELMRLGLGNQVVRVK